MVTKNVAWVGVAAFVALSYETAFAVDFNTGFGDVAGAWVTNVTGATGLRTKDPSCSLTGDPNAGGSGACGSAASTALWANGDNGDLNYRKTSFYTANVDVVTELLLTAPAEGWKFLARGQAFYDFAVAQTDRTALSDPARQQAERNASLLDLFIEKDFSVGLQSGHVRVGNQVINWGESYYAFGGINQTNSIDIQKLSTPGTLLKQVLLPAPMVEFESSLPGRVSFEGYVQAHWYANRYPPVGTFWSYNDTFGRGGLPASFSTTNFNFSGPDAGTIAGLLSHNNAVNNQINQNLTNGLYAGAPYFSLGVPYTTVDGGNNRPEYGLRVNYKPEHLQADFSLYYENYTDKSPILTYYNTESSAIWSYLQKRSLFGASANFQLGDWAVGTELSFRPHDAVAMSGCYGAGGPADANTNLASGNCAAYKDFQKYQFDINGQLIMSRSSQPFIKLLGATQAVLTTEATWIQYPGVDPNRQYASAVNGKKVYQVVDAEYVTWQDTSNRSGLGYPIAAGQGTAGSAGLLVDFNWTYDGNLIHGWGVTPGVTLFEAVHGYTPSFQANYEVGYKSANFYTLFYQNPAVWNAGINYTVFYGGNSLTQPYSDRNNVGVFVTRNF